MGLLVKRNVTHAKAGANINTSYFAKDAISILNVTPLSGFSQEVEILSFSFFAW